MPTPPSSTASSLPPTDNPKTPRSGGSGSEYYSEIPYDQTPSPASYLHAKDQVNMNTNRYDMVSRSNKICRSILEYLVRNMSTISLHAVTSSWITNNYQYRGNTSPDFVDFLNHMHAISKKIFFIHLFMCASDFLRNTCWISIWNNVGHWMFSGLLFI